MKTNALLRVTALLQPHYCLRAVRLTLRKSSRLRIHFHLPEMTPPTTTKVDLKQDGLDIKLNWQVGDVINLLTVDSESEKPLLIIQ